MRYNLNGFTEPEFQRLDHLVKAVILSSGPVDTWHTIRRVTSDLNDLPKSYRDKVTRALELEGELLRAICSPSPNNDYEFDLWFNPAVLDNTSRFQATILHELCHGYIGVDKGHNDQWRRLYTRTLFHYHNQVAPIDHYISLVDLSNWRYTKRGKSETSRQFLKRINSDKTRWLQQADEERDRVRDIWKRMS